MSMRRPWCALSLLAMVSSTVACASAPRPVPVPSPSPEGAPTAADLLEREGRAALAAGDGALRKAVEDQRLAILAAALEKDRVETAVRVSDEDVRRYYDGHPDEFDQPPQLNLRHIFKRVSRQATPAEREQVRREMESILERLRGGAGFDTLAHEASDSETAGHGGQISPQARGGLPPAVEAVVWALEVGQLSEIVPTSVGFHVFRLDAIQPAKRVGLEEARERIGRRLATARETEAREALFQELLRESGARYDPGALQKRPLEGDPALFVLGPTRVGLQDVVEQWRALPFARQRLEGLRDVLQERARVELYAWGADRLRIANRPEVAERLAAAERRALGDWAYDRRLTALLRGARDGAVASYFKEHRARFASPARYRMRLISRRYPDDRVPYAAYEELALLSRQIREGARDFAAAAREVSDDPSALEGGSLGWASLYELSNWAGYEAGSKLTSLTPNTVSDPLLIEVYQPERLRHRRDGYMLVLVEEVAAPAAPASVDEIRDRVEKAYALQHAGELRAKIEAEVRAQRVP